MSLGLALTASNFEQYDAYKGENPRILTEGPLVHPAIPFCHFIRSIYPCNDSTKENKKMCSQVYYYTHLTA